VPSAAESAGGELPERTRLGAHALVLNGAGLNERLFFRVYVAGLYLTDAGLYLTEKRQSSADLYALAGPKRVRITLMRNLPARELVDALTNGIRANSPPEERQA
jgi:long-chain acyl-CoA synthetase